MFKSKNFRSSIGPCLLILLLCFPLMLNLIDLSDPLALKNKMNNAAEDIVPKESAPSEKFNSLSGTIDKRKGKKYSNITLQPQSCEIHRDQPGLDSQPQVDLNGWNMTHANIEFDNLTAVNHTRNLETETNGAVQAEVGHPTIIYQKFAVKTSQFINNISIYIQDIRDDYNNFTKGNSWNISIVNCSNDEYGTPDDQGLIGSLRNPHPTDYYSKWMIFDFKTDAEPVYLNKSHTNVTINEKGEKLYWFALKIKIPPDDSAYGGGPKFLYLNPDKRIESEIGEGETFRFYESITAENFTVNNVTEILSLTNGSIQSGSVDSMRLMDEDRFIFEPYSDNLSLYLDMEVENVTEYSYDQLLSIGPSLWEIYRPIFSIDIELATNISNLDAIESAELKIYNYSGEHWVSLKDELNITRGNETLIKTCFEEQSVIRTIIGLMNTTENNTFTFLFEYQGNGDPFSVAINKFTANFGVLYQINNTILKNDPLLTEFYLPQEDEIENGTAIATDIDLVKYNDNDYYRAEANTNNLSVEFKFNLLENTDTSLWDISLYDWLYFYQRQLVPQIDFHISANVSIPSSDLEIATLEVYNGKGEFDIGGDTINQTWIEIGDNNRSMAFEDEQPIVSKIPPTYTWIFLQLMNTSDDNSLRFRLRYLCNNSVSYNFNVSIDEMTLYLYIQNVYGSDIASKIGVGLNTNNLLPSDIQLKNFGTEVLNDGYRKGLWESEFKGEYKDQGLYYFNVTSLWKEIHFDVIGTYEIEISTNFQWNYLISSNSQEILWNVTAYPEYYDPPNGNIVPESQGYMAITPANWTLINIYNCSDPNSIIDNSEGFWSWNIESSGNLQRISVNNISSNLWKLHMNSSVTPINAKYNKTTEIKIDEQLNLELELDNQAGGILSYEVFNDAGEIIYNTGTTLNESALEKNANFIWNIYSTTKSPGIYHLKSSWLKFNDTHAFLAFDFDEINVSKYKTKLELLDIESFANDTVYGTQIIVSGKLTYEETEDPVIGETIKILISDGEGNLIETLTDITNEDGIAKVEYVVPSDQEKISIRLAYDEEDSYYSTSESSQVLEISLISQGQAYLNTFMDYLPYILGILAALFAIVMVRRRRLNKLRELWSKDALILDDLLKISYIMIIHKDAGVVIYNKKIGIEEIDQDLIGGFLHAISQFRKEFKKKESHKSLKKGFEMDYYDFKIMITDGDYVRVAMVCEGKPSEILKENQRKFTEEFEKHYGKHLRKFDGSMAPFRSTDSLIDKYFHTDLAYPLRLSEITQLDFDELDSLETALIEVAEEIQKEKKFFFISNLLSFGLAGRKESRNQIISTIISLQEKGILKPVELE